MTYLLVFALGFLVAAVLDVFMPGAFGKVKIGMAGAVAVVAGIWDKLPWSGF